MDLSFVLLLMADFPLSSVLSSLLITPVFHEDLFSDKDSEKNVLDQLGVVLDSLE